MTGYRGCMYCIVHEKKSCFKRVTHIIKSVITSEKKKKGISQLLFTIFEDITLLSIAIKSDVKVLALSSPYHPSPTVL